MNTTDILEIPEKPFSLEECTTLVSGYYCNTYNIEEDAMHEIARIYNEVGRYHHTMRHLYEILKVVLVFVHRNEGEQNTLDYSAYIKPEFKGLSPEFFIGVLGHDFEQSFEYTHNKRYSALFALTLKPFITGNVNFMKVYRYIMETTVDNHWRKRKENDPQLDLFLDLDLGFLLTPDSLVESNLAMMKEFMFKGFSIDQVMLGRFNFLEKLEGKDQLFLSDYFKPKEGEARLNLTRIIEEFDNFGYREKLEVFSKERISV